MNNLKQANAICDELQQLHIEKTTEAIGFAPADNPEIRLEKIEVATKRALINHVLETV